MTSNIYNMYKAKPTFAEVNEPQDAGDYIKNKKLKYSFCNPNVCKPNKNIGSSSKLLMLKNANNLAFYGCLDNFDKTQLYTNLYSKLQLNSQVYVLMDASGSPVIVNPSNPTPYNTYVIDPFGDLFGNTICGLNNWKKYVTYDISGNVII